jgi:hypothetical protein
MKNLIFTLGLLACALLAQRSDDRPKIGSVIALPSERIPPGSCKASTAGYLEVSGRTVLTKPEVGQYVTDALREGYILTIYPATKRGIFVNAECVSSAATP